GPEVPLRAYALALLARHRLMMRRPELALEHAREGMELMTKLGGMEEGESLLWTSYALALRNAGRESEGRAAFSEGRTRLLARADRINDAAWRKGFLEGVVDNARLIELAGQSLEAPGEPREGPHEAARAFADNPGPLEGHADPPLTFAVVSSAADAED